MPYAHFAGGGFWWPLIPLFWLLVWGAVIFFVVRARRRGWNPWAAQARPSGPPRPAAEDILAERFARGEISDDEYYQRLSVLKEGRS